MQNWHFASLAMRGIFAHARNNGRQQKRCWLLEMHRTLNLLLPTRTQVQSIGRRCKCNTRIATPVIK
jgi:hypothetical protein